MSIFALSDLHLSFGVNKPMNVFGKAWHNYEEKIRENWEREVSDDDFVLICGDFSWATYVDEAKLDFEFINALPGQKIISKGNHDYWWTTAAKQKEFLEQNNLDKISFLHNNSYVLGEDVAVCGARGWTPEEMHKNDEDRKIYDRELIRLELSLKSIPSSASTKIAMLHYPPDNKVMQILSDYKVDECVYGHLHAQSHKYAVYGTLDGVRYNLTSCDYLGFSPFKIM
ncbi:MAG: metallophosphoesterase [Oscillospiraceae bacterium]|nr:metallophosphoesterase [Oscillospiraceae bacterium]